MYPLPSPTPPRRDRPERRADTRLMTALAAELRCGPHRARGVVLDAGARGLRVVFDEPLVVDCDRATLALSLPGWGRWEAVAEIVRRAPGEGGGGCVVVRVREDRRGCLPGPLRPGPATWAPGGTPRPAPVRRAEIRALAGSVIGNELAGSGGPPAELVAWAGALAAECGLALTEPVDGPALRAAVAELIAT